MVQWSAKQIARPCLAVPCGIQSSLGYLGCPLVRSVASWDFYLQVVSCCNLVLPSTFLAFHIHAATTLIV